MVKTLISKESANTLSVKVEKTAPDVIVSKPLPFWNEQCLENSAKLWLPSESALKNNKLSDSQNETLQKTKRVAIFDTRFFWFHTKNRQKFSDG